MKRLLKHTIWALMSLFITGTIVAGLIIIYFETSLPNITSLKDVQLQVPLRIYTNDGKLIAEYGAIQRIPVDFNQVPPLLVNAILATEDQRYYEHPGVDPLGLLRAAVQLVTTGTKSQGGSTITMQVARNFFLTRKKTYTRKIREILLAIKIDSEFSKQKVLELYLNRIYLGNRAYGVAAAAQVYYGKNLNQLTIAEIAMLAGLPQAPSTANPLANPVAAKNRRDHVLSRMYDKHLITQAQYQTAINSPLDAKYHGEPITVTAPYIAEMVRDAMVEHYGDKAYTDGFNVYTTVNSQDQTAANNALRQALIAYDQRHGYRGPTANWGNIDSSVTLKTWIKKLSGIVSINGLEAAVVTKVNAQSAEAVLGNGKIVTIPWQNMVWARKETNNYAWGAAPQTASDILKVGDLIRVESLPDQTWRLGQIPDAQGALIALNPKNGAIIALVGGFDYVRSNFNRVIQAERQPGSSFKPFIYAAALDKGDSLATIINDAPIVVNQPSSNTLWRPQNDTRQFYGPTRLRVALAQSRNLASIRLLRDIGIDYAVDYATRFGFDANDLPHTLSLALGTAMVTPLEMATGYAVFANGGYQVSPYLIDHISDTDNKSIYQANPKLACENCVNLNDAQDHYPIAPEVLAPRVISPQIAYLMTSAMQSVVRQGTGHAAMVLKRNDLAGKTGTSNDEKDAWFSGFNSDIVTTVWMGFDQPQSLHEYGDQAALPMWIDFMRQVLAGKPEHSMSEPPNIITAKINPQTGLLAYPGESGAIFEIFEKGVVPAQSSSNAGSSDDGGLTEQGEQPLF